MYKYIYSSCWDTKKNSCTKWIQYRDYRYLFYSHPNIKNDAEKWRRTSSSINIILILIYRSRHYDGSYCWYNKFMTFFFSFRHIDKFLFLTNELIFSISLISRIFVIKIYARQCFSNQICTCIDFENYMILSNFSEWCSKNPWIILPNNIKADNKKWSDS